MWQRYVLLLIYICGSNLELDDPAHLTMAPEPPSLKIEPTQVLILFYVK